MAILLCATAPFFLWLTTVASVASALHWLHAPDMPPMLALRLLALLCAAVPLGCSAPAYVVRAWGHGWVRV